MSRSILLLATVLVLSGCNGTAEDAGVDLRTAASEIEQVSHKQFGISVEALSLLVIDGPVTSTHEQTIRLGDIGRRYRELEAAGYVRFEVPGSKRAPRTGSGEPIHIVQTERGRAVHSAFAP